MKDLINIRAQTSKIVLLLLWLHIPLSGLISFLTGSPWATPIAAVLALAVVPTIFNKTGPNAAATRFVMAACLMGSVAVFVFQLAGHPWQIDMHMYFFATLAILAAFCDWKTILVGTATVAVHHLALNFVLPFAVFPDGASFFRVVLHAVVISVEAGVLAWLCLKITSAFISSENALNEAEQAQANAENLSEDKIKAEEAIGRQREEALAEVSSQFKLSAGKAIEELDSKLQVLGTTSTEVANEVTEASSNSSQARQISNDVAESVDDVASSFDEMDAAVREIAQKVGEATSLADNARLQAERTNETVKDLDAGSEKIGNVVTLIQDIAEQTNLLALNATIEAARAGDAGKGFAVVASEVKNLANQTAQATEEISGEIESLQSISSSATEAMSAIGNSINGISENSSVVASAIEEISVTFNQISEGTNNAASGARTLSDKMANLEEISRHVGQSAQSVASSATQLSADQSQINSQIEAFLDDLKNSA